MIYFEAIYAVFCIALAYANKVRIKKDQRIYHGVNGFFHLVVWFVFYVKFKTALVVVLPFIARLFFDAFLNWFRGLDAGYVPEKPKSIADKVEKFIFRENAITPKVLYFWIILICIIIQSDL